MPERTLIARVRPDDSDPATLLVSAPTVGQVDGTPRPGVFLNRFDPLLTMMIHGRRHVLRLPRDVHGWVVQAFTADALTPVAFDAPLVRLDPRVGALDGDHVRESGMPSAGDDPDRGDSLAVTAPSDGIFYRRPSLDAPNFVEVGAPIAHGTVLGLVEVMKCFNQITYGGPGLPARGEVARIFVADAAEVRFGQTLFWIRPIE